jgi:hypothetical protein
VNAAPSPAGAPTDCDIICRLEEDPLMTIPILAAVLGVLIATAAITIPRLVARGNHPEDQADSQAYLEQSGRSAEDIAQGNAARAPQQQNDGRSQPTGGSDHELRQRHAVWLRSSRGGGAVSEQGVVFGLSGVLPAGDIGQLRTVSVCAVPDAADLDRVLPLIDLVDNPVGAAPGGMQSLIGAVKGFAHSHGVGRQRAADQLPRRCGDTRRQFIL